MHGAVLKIFGTGADRGAIFPGAGAGRASLVLTKLSGAVFKDRLLQNANTSFSRGEIFWPEDAEGDDQLHPGPKGQRALGICHCRRQGPGDNLSLSLSCDNLSLSEARTR